MRDYSMDETVTGSYTDNDAARNLPDDPHRLWDEVHECSSCIRRILTDAEDKMYFDVEESSVTVAAYLLLLVSVNKDPQSVAFGDLAQLRANKDALAVASAHGFEKVWSDLRDLTKKYEWFVFQKVIGFWKGAPTMLSIINITKDLLAIRKGETVADYYCGTDGFAYLCGAEPRVVGYTLDRDFAVVGSIREECFHENVHIENADVFSIAAKDTDMPTFDKIFSNYPIGQRVRDLGEAGKAYAERLAERIPAILKATSADWIHNMLIIDALRHDGKAIGIMASGGTWNTTDAQIRKYFIENGLIECVIALPEKLFDETHIATSMVVFSHGNDRVRLVDASKQFHPERRMNKLTNEDAEAILQAAAKDGDISLTVSLEDLRKNDYVLSMKRYTIPAEDAENGVPFESVIKRITRGAPLKAEDLDKLSSPVPTTMQYLMLSNIQSGLIDAELPYLREIGKKNEKYCLTHRCLILSKNGYPYKVAVAEMRGEQKILANGNLYVIELYEDKADPYYVAAYFGSERGAAALKRITVGATVPNIGVDQLKRLPLPLPPMKEQKEIAARYKAAKEEIFALQRKLEETQNSILHIFDKKSK